LLFVGFVGLRATVGECLRIDIATGKRVIPNRHTVLQQPEAIKLVFIFIAAYYFSKRDERL